MLYKAVVEIWQNGEREEKKFRVHAEHEEGVRSFLLSTSLYNIPNLQRINILSIEVVK